MRILLADEIQAFGGAQIAICAAAEALARAGSKVTVVTPSPVPRFASLLRRLKEHGINVIESEPFGARGTLSLIRSLRREPAAEAAKFLENIRPEAVILNLSDLWRGSAVLDAIEDLRTDCLVGGFVQLGHLPSTVGAKAGLLRDLLIPSHLRRFNVLLAVSDSQAGYLRSISAVRVETVYQPVPATIRKSFPTKFEARKAIGRSPNDFVVGLLGRVVFSHKGQDVAVQIARRLRARHLAVTWIVVGDGPDLPKMKSMVRSNGLESCFTFVGWRDDVEDLIPAFDVVALPSHYEGMPLTAVEAISAGVPVVAFGVDGLRDLLDTPFVVSPGDEAAMTTCIEMLLHNGSAWPAEESRLLAQKLCNPDRVAERILDVFAKVGNEQ